MHPVFFRCHTLTVNQTSALWIKGCEPKKTTSTRLNWKNKKVTITEDEMQRSTPLRGKYVDSITLQDVIKEERLKEATVKSRWLVKHNRRDSGEIRKHVMLTEWREALRKATLKRITCGRLKVSNVPKWNRSCDRMAYIGDYSHIRIV